VLTSLLREGIISLFVGTGVIGELKMGNAYLALSLQHCKPFFPLENNDQKVQT
jgi:hypothetical protein